MAVISHFGEKKRGRDLPHPAGEGWGGGEVDDEISARYQKQPIPHPNLPPPGEGTENHKLAPMPVKGGGVISKASAKASTE